SPRAEGNQPRSSESAEEGGASAIAELIDRAPEARERALRRHAAVRDQVRGSIDLEPAAVDRHGAHGLSAMDELLQERGHEHPGEVAPLVRAGRVEAPMQLDEQRSAVGAHADQPHVLGLDLVVRLGAAADLEDVAAWIEL